MSPATIADVTDAKELCVNCSMRKGTERWVGEFDSVTVARTGWHQMWCRRCVIVAQLEHARKLAATIPDLERELVALVLGSVFKTDGAAQTQRRQSDPVCRVQCAGLSHRRHVIIIC